MSKMSSEADQTRSAVVSVVPGHAEVDTGSYAASAEMVLKDEPDEGKPRRSRLRFQTPDTYEGRIENGASGGLLPSDDEKPAAWDGDDDDLASVGSSASSSSSAASSSRSLSFEPNLPRHRSEVSSPASIGEGGTGTGSVASRTPRRLPKVQARPPQLITHLPLAEWEAMQTFDELPRNWYERTKLGRSKGQEEGMICECRYRHGELHLPSLRRVGSVGLAEALIIALNLLLHTAPRLAGDNPALVACSEDSGCINRLTQVECLASDCHCKEHCQNQR